jgi:hypothetical protein
VSETLSSGLDHFNASLARYALFSKKQQGPLIEDRARKLRFELFKHFKAIAKTGAELRAEIASLGFGIKRRKGDDGKPVDTATEIKARVKSLRFLSVSFLMQAWRAKQQGQVGTFRARARSGTQIGIANVATEVGRENPFVSLTSLLEGAVKQDSEKRIVDRALVAQSRDMETYLERKHEEKLRQMFGNVFNGAKTFVL